MCYHNLSQYANDVVYMFVCVCMLYDSAAQTEGQVGKLMARSRHSEWL